MGHILENAPNNLASQLRTAPSGLGFQAFPVFGATEQDPWHQGASDPWSAAASEYPAPQGPPASAFPQWDGTVNSDQQQAYLQQGEYADTDTETISSLGEMDYSESTLRHMTPAQVDEHISWAYQDAKSRFRKHMRKPTRKVR